MNGGGASSCVQSREGGGRSCGRGAATSAFFFGGGETPKADRSSWTVEDAARRSRSPSKRSLDVSPPFSSGSGRSGGSVLALAASFGHDGSDLERQIRVQRSSVLPESRTDDPDEAPSLVQAGLQMVVFGQELTSREAADADQPDSQSIDDESSFSKGFQRPRVADQLVAASLRLPLPQELNARSGAREEEEETPFYLLV